MLQQHGWVGRVVHLHILPVLVLQIYTGVMQREFVATELRLDSDENGGQETQQPTTDMQKRNIARLLSQRACSG
jgi:hypothetical protein